MNTKEPQVQVLVSQPGRQHVHQLCIALQQKGLLQTLLTSVWYKPQAIFFQSLKKLPERFFKPLEHMLKKRYHPALDETKIKLFPVPELLRQLIVAMFRATNERWVFYVERLHDRYVAQQLKKLLPDIVIGYEKASLHTFKKAKSLGITTILDLAQVHFTHINHLRERYPPFKALMRDDLFNTINQIKEVEYQYADHVFTLSTYAKQTLIEAGVPKERIHTVNLGFDPTKFSIKTQYRKQGIFHILFVGTITRRKGIHLLLKVFQQLEVSDCQLTIVGPVLDGQDILDQYKGLYTYKPFMHHEELAQQYQEADIFVFPSYLDSWAMTVVEAMASGTPVIVTENTGSKDVVVQGGGFIVPVDDVEALKEKILFFYKNREEVERIGRQAHIIASRYTWQSYYEQIQDIIQEIYTKENKIEKVTHLL